MATYSDTLQALTDFRSEVLQRQQARRLPRLAVSAKELSRLNRLPPV